MWPPVCETTSIRRRRTSSASGWSWARSKRLTSCGPRMDSSNAIEPRPNAEVGRSEEHTSELQSPCNLVCRLLLEKKKKTQKKGNNKRQDALSSDRILITD